MLSREPGPWEAAGLPLPPAAPSPAEGPALHTVGTLASVCCTELKNLPPSQTSAEEKHFVGCCFREQGRGSRIMRAAASFPCFVPPDPLRMLSSGACSLDPWPCGERASFLLGTHTCRQAATPELPGVSFHLGSPGVVQKKGGCQGCISPVHGAGRPVKEVQNMLQVPAPCQARG